MSDILLIISAVIPSIVTGFVAWINRPKNKKVLFLEIKCDRAVHLFSLENLISYQVNSEKRCIEISYFIESKIAHKNLIEFQTCKIIDINKN